jgi:sugar O-acyltransferase (sialic acid O-acetyltransferase NeuD family)
VHQGPSNERLVILGTRSFAEEVAELAEQCGHEVAAFVENWERERCSQRLLDRDVVWIDDSDALARDHAALCALGTTRRRGFVEQATAHGFSFATLVHPSAVVAPSAELGAGTIVGAGAVIGGQTRIGAHVIVNRGVLVGHHTRVGDYVTISPGANVAGCVSIGEQTYIGMAAVVLDHRAVGAGSVVGAGALVTRDVADRTLVQGLPARPVAEAIEPH